ncbi:MAG: poly-beta-1,6 N-acetyl-D-glucosamine export porin PgaA [Proteobacteria bacterium]|nr:poly-beta-1,6 N-acetyl-D-glucosamine export porin PgaA [Pseudomonadota bacterium]
MELTLRGQLVLLLSVLALAGAPVVASAQTPTEQREAAILKSRAGQKAEAQAALRAMLANGVDDGLVAMDLATLLQQDGKPAEAVAVFEAANKADPPDYALLAATRAYRDLGKFDDAARLARQGERRFPDDSVWPLVLSLVLSDANKTGEALAVLKTPGARRAPPVERLMAEGYAWRRAGNIASALSAYGEAIRLSGNNPGVRKEAAGVLVDAGAPYGAAMLAGNTPSIDAAQAGAMVRWGEQTRPPEPSRRFEGTDAALARLDALLAATPPEETALRRRLRIDRMIALRDRMRMAEALAEGEALRADGKLPANAEQAYADALLYNRRPEDARAAYERVLAENPGDVQALYGLFFANVEVEDFRKAYAIVDTLAKDEPVWRYYENSPARHANGERAYAQTIAGQARAWGNQLGEAWDRLEPLVAAAPANGNMRLALYGVANARGWPRRARDEGEIAIGLAPRDIGSRIAAVEIAIAAYRFAEAQRLLAALQAEYPEDLGVQRLARDLDAKRRFLLDVQVQPSNSDGGGANASGVAMVSEARLYSPPIADNWRIFAVGDWNFANPPEGNVQRVRAGGGLEWRIPWVTATIYPTANMGTLQKAGGGATVDWWLTDQIELSASAELFSLASPLRGLYYGISANEFAAKATYRWHESRNVSLRLAYLPFTDGNQRFAGGFAYEERAINVPGFDLTGRLQAYASTNSMGGTQPYYNPSQDLSLTGGFLAEHVLWRRYENSLVHALTVDAGLYAEQNYASNWIGTINYEHRWRFDPLTEFRYGVQLMRRVYDGSVENTLGFLVGLRQRI